MVTIYLSSTLKDLLPEREAVKQALSGMAVVKESYDADKSSVRASCLKDVEGCDVHVGLIGLRYGFILRGKASQSPNSNSIRPKIVRSESCCS
jgi:hypothetical protein